MNLSQKLLKNFIAKRAKLVGEQILPFIFDNENILDFGCGNMFISDFIAKNRQVDITGLDIIDYNTGKFKFIKYKEGKLPIKDDIFDVAIAAFVLHHTENPSFYLRELRRITRKRIILIEDTYVNKFEQTVTYIVDWVGNHLESCSINIPFNFKSIIEWKRLFIHNSLELQKLIRFYPHPVPWIPTRNIIMVLKK